MLQWCVLHDLFKQQLVSWQSLHGSQEVRGETEALTLGALLAHLKDLSELAGGLLVFHQSLHGNLELIEVSTIDIHRFRLVKERGRGTERRILQG